MEETKKPIRFVRKSESWLMRAIGFVLLPFTPTFMEKFWTTLGHTIYTPTKLDADKDWGTAIWLQRHAHVINHEAIHVLQAERWGMLVQAFLVLGPTPLPVLLSWGRWRVEREAYLPRIAAARRDGNRADVTDWIVDTLWRNYMWTYPRGWMRDWFDAHQFEE